MLKSAQMLIRCIEIGFHKLILLFNTFRGDGGTIKDQFPFVCIPKDAVANTDEQNSDLSPTLMSPLNRAPPLIKSFRRPSID